MQRNNYYYVMCATEDFTHTVWILLFQGHQQAVGCAVTVLFVRVVEAVNQEEMGHFPSGVQTILSVERAIN